jgi:hypothetical protein
MSLTPSHLRTIRGLLRHAYECIDDAARVINDAPLPRTSDETDLSGRLNVILVRVADEQANVERVLAEAERG